ncbi:hypothetical protein QL285_011607 [Trifolium repens]|nr:hypothetical protein QL285_011607 [Trifolium repens]
MDARGANTFLSHNQLPNLNQGFRDIFLSPSGINKHQWRLHCMKNGSDFPARYREYNSSRPFFTSNFILSPYLIIGAFYKKGFVSRHSLRISLMKIIYLKN